MNTFVIGAARLFRLIIEDRMMEIKMKPRYTNLDSLRCCGFSGTTNVPSSSKDTAALTQLRLTIGIDTHINLPN